MSISVDLLTGMANSVEQHLQTNPDASARLELAQCLQKMTAAMDECISGFGNAKQVPHRSLALFLEQSKTLKRLLGDNMDEATTKALKNALINAQMFDKDLETSLEQFKPKLLNTFLFGAPINWMFGAGRASKKVAAANERLRAFEKQLQS